MRKDSSIPYVYQKRGVYYFSRRVPKDLFEFHKRPNVTLSLKTKSSRVAKAKSATLAAQLDEQWLTVLPPYSCSTLIFFLSRGEYFDDTEAVF